MQQIENRERVTTRDTHVGQTTGHLHHPVSNPRLGEAQDIFDHSTAFAPGDHVFHHAACRGDTPVPQALAHPQGLVCGLFFGGAVRTRSGSSPGTPVALSSVAFVGEASWASSAAFLACVRPAIVGPRESTWLVRSLPNSRFFSVCVFFLPL